MIFWFVIVMSAIAIGTASFYFLEGKKAGILAALTPWTIFLIFNLYSELYSLDRDVVHGSWLFFQVFIGSLLAIIGIISGFLIKKLIGGH